MNDNEKLTVETSNFQIFQKEKVNLVMVQLKTVTNPAQLIKI